MSHHHAHVLWQRQADERFTDQRYSRRHTWKFDGGAVIAAAASPQVVPLPLTDASAVDPEEAFIAALASCHMLWFLSIAAAAGWVVDRYEDAAEGLLGPEHPPTPATPQPRTCITRVSLRPQVHFAGNHGPDPATLAHLHHQAHEACFLAASVRFPIEIEMANR